MRELDFIDEEIAFSFDRDVLLIPDILIEENVKDSDVPILLNPLINSIWNACGYQNSPNYDTVGNYKNKL
jgi:hypothetical protein